MLLWLVLTLQIAISISVSNLCSQSARLVYDTVRSRLSNLSKPFEASNESSLTKNVTENIYPSVTIAYAQTIDGSIAPLTKDRLNISSSTSFRLLHSLRELHSGVLIGIKTLIGDRPRLTARDMLEGINVPNDSLQPRAIILDSNLSFLKDEGLVIRVNRPIFLTCVSPNHDDFIRASQMLSTHGGEVVACQFDGLNRVDLKHAFRLLKNMGISSILVEGGANVLQSVLASGLCDQVIVTMRPAFLGGYRALKSQLESPLYLTNVKLAVVGGDVIILGQIKGQNQDQKKELTDDMRSEVDIYDVRYLS